MTIPILIIDNYDSFTYNLYQLLQETLSGNVEVHRNDKITFEEVKKLAPKRIVLSPGPGHPAIDEDFGVCKEIIINQSVLHCSILGVCLGHQGIVQHLGGNVVRAPQIVHGKSSEIALEGKSPLFDGLPSKFQAMRYHSLVAAEDNTFPEDLQILAREKEHNLIMAIQHKTKPIYGVQFHPESIGTPEGKHMLRNFLEKC